MKISKTHEANDVMSMVPTSATPISRLRIILICNIDIEACGLK